MEGQDQTGVDINQASREELVNVPGIGPVLAERVMAGRPYTRLEDLEKVNGISTSLMKKLLPYLALEPEKPTDPVSLDTPEEVMAVFPQAPDNPDPIDPPIQAVLPAQVVEEAREPEPRSGVQPVIDFISDMAGRVEQVVRRPTEHQGNPERPNPRPDVERRLTIIPQWARIENKPGFDKTDALLWGVGIGVLVFTLSVLVSLGILLGVNGSLSFIPSREMVSIQAKLDAINSNIDSLQEETGSLRQRLDAFESLSGRLKVMEEETVSLRTEMDKTNTAITSLQTQAKQLDEQVAALSDRSQVFDQFLENLQTLLNELNPETK